MSKMRLEFYGHEAPVLERTVYENAGGLRHECMRGKTAGAFREMSGIGTFQWTNAVKSLAVVFLEASISSTNNVPSVRPQLIGGKGSFATSIVYALYKKPLWILDMFGLSESGETEASFLFLITNGTLRNGLPAALRLNSRRLSYGKIEIIWQEKRINAAEEKVLLLKRIKEESGMSTNLNFFHGFYEAAA